MSKGVQAMNAAITTRSAAARAGGLIGRHKVISAVVALFAAAVIAVSLATTGTSAAPRPVPVSAHAFTLPSLADPAKQVSLSQYQGKPVIVNFFASWCEPCQQETPLLASWYKQQGGRVAMIGLDSSDTTAPAQKFVQAKGVTYPVAFDPNTTVAPAYGLNGLPYTFFLNARHQIVDHVAGPVTQAELAKGVKLMTANG